MSVPRFTYGGAPLPTLNAALRAAVRGGEAEAVILAPMRGISYHYRPETGELWRLRSNGRGAQRMKDRRLA